LGLILATTTYGNISPYLQTPTPTSMYICWKTGSGTESRVEYGTTTALGEIANGDCDSLANQYYWHSVKLTDLNPNTCYYYKCLTDDDYSKVQKFKTLPTIENSNGHIRFAVLGDNRTYPNDHCRVINAMKDKFIELFGEDFESAIDFVMNSGDIVTDGRNLSEYQIEYFEPIAPLSGKIPFMISIGNHERESNYFYQFMKYEDFGGQQGERYYQFRIGPAVFISLNSNTQFRTDIQINWLNSMLSEAQNDETVEWIFSFCHHCGLTEHNTRLNTDFVQNRILPTLANYSKAEFHIYGHNHCYARGTFPDSNVRLMCSGGGGGPLSRWGAHSDQTDYPEIQKTIGHYNYSIIDIDLSNHSYSCETYSLGHSDLPRNNELIDSFYRNHLDTVPPDKPFTAAVYDTIVLPYTLEASEYSGEHSVMSSHFQLTNLSGNYSNPVVDLKRDFENIWGETGPPDYEPIDRNKDIELNKFPISKDSLNESGTYYWRVRYRDRNLLWSNWSDDAQIYIRGPDDISNTLDFDGIDDYVNLPNIKDLAITGNYGSYRYTVEAWFLIKPGKEGERRCLFESEFYTISCEISDDRCGTGDNKLVYHVNYPQGHIKQCTDIVPMVNEWHHVAIVVDNKGNNIVSKIYYDGELAGSETVTDAKITPVGNHLNIGAHRDVGRFFKGQIDEIRFWNVVRTESEIKENMYYSVSDDDTGLMAYYRFDESKGNVLPDYSKNKYDGVVYGATWEFSTAPIKKKVSSINDISTISSSLNLRAVYPNPFNSITTMKFSLAKESYVQMNIYNINGRKVAELVNGYLTTGEYKTNWDAKNYTSGVYFVNLYSENQYLSQKIILLK